jgi:hypothetical protein
MTAVEGADRKTHFTGTNHCHRRMVALNETRFLAAS